MSVNKGSYISLLGNEKPNVEQKGHYKSIIGQMSLFLWSRMGFYICFSERASISVRQKKFLYLLFRKRASILVRQNEFISVTKFTSSFN